MDFRNHWRLAQAMNRKGLAGPAGVVIGVMISIIVIVAVALPVVQDVVTNVTCGTETNLSICTPTVSGTTSTILELLPLFLGLAALVVVAALFA